jgi:tRNA(fMet)-specific endonuclease VapC
MTHLLDTNPCIRYLNGRSETLRNRIDSAGEGALAVCSVVKAELHFGALKSKSPERAMAGQRAFVGRFPSLTFDDNAAEAYAVIRAELEKRGSPIGANDLLIAAIAVANNLALVSQNVREFSRVSSLRIEDWEQP